MTTVITETLSFGEQKGSNFKKAVIFNDVVDVGGFPSEQKIKGIKQIKLMHGYLVDGIQVTYQMTDGSTKLGPVRGGEGERHSTVDFGTHEVLVGVTGKLSLPSYKPYSGLPYLCALRFMIADTATGAQRVAGPYGYEDDPATYVGKPFTVAGNIIAFGGKSFTEGNVPVNNVALSFIKSVSVDNSNGLVPI